MLFPKTPTQHEPQDEKHWPSVRGHRTAETLHAPQDEIDTAQEDTGLHGDFLKGIRSGTMKQQEG